MSRPLKTGLDYFPMDVDMDDKVELIEAKHGIIGFGILIKLYQRIYKEGYYLRWNEETQLLFSRRINVDINEVIEVVNDCLRYHLFDKTLHKKYQILTSHGIQSRFLQAIDRRKYAEMIKNYVIVDINGLNVNINLINVDISTQSKVKESKEKKSKGKEMNVDNIENDLIYPFSSENFKKIWFYWKEYKMREHKFRYKTMFSEQAALKMLGDLSKQNEEEAVAIIKQSISNGWKGLFEIKNDIHGKNKIIDTSIMQDILDQRERARKANVT